WLELRIRSVEGSFAWGPPGGGTMRELGAIELAIAAPPRGRGTISIEDLPFEDRPPRAPPRPAPSGSPPGHPPPDALDAAPATAWRSAPGAPQWLALDFGQDHELGGLVVDWAPGLGARGFEVQASDDGRAFRTLWSASQAEGPRSLVGLVGGA